ncbi:MAG: NADH-quinone oxidoreductase subunit J [Halobacteriovoraceae bacterium]|nr:NADH-quinone oxidoreductase subunit J [Halobacteriovoraceae bacterium]
MYVNILFLTSALLTVGCAVAMLIARNIMHSCIFLLGTLIGIAGLYVTLGADFVAVTQTMVYVGGIVILMLFAVMLTGGKEFVSRAQKLLGLIPAMGNKWSFGIAFLTSFVFVLSQFVLIKNIVKGVEVTKEAKPFVSTVEEIGELLLTDHVLAFELSSVLLLGALIGAAIIARPRKERVAND